MDIMGSFAQVLRCIPLLRDSDIAPCRTNNEKMDAVVMTKVFVILI